MPEVWTGAAKEMTLGKLGVSKVTVGPMASTWVIRNEEKGERVRQCTRTFKGWLGWFFSSRGRVELALSAKIRKLKGTELSSVLVVTMFHLQASPPPFF